MIQFYKVITSDIDDTRKYIYRLDDNLKAEIAVIFRKKNRISLCIPSQTWCNMKCRMCHLTNSPYSQKTRNLLSKEIYQMVYQTIISLPEELLDDKEELLIAYMGIGEPLLNIYNIVSATNNIKSMFQFPKFKVSISTMVPENSIDKLEYFAQEMKNEHSKIHYSIHGMFNREYLIPKGKDYKEVINTLKTINKNYNTELELHYNLINGVNDSIEEIRELAKLDIPVSFIRLADTDELFKTPESHVNKIEETLKLEFPNLDFECYTPPGASIRASCGQFSVEEYGSRG